MPDRLKTRNRCSEEDNIRKECIKKYDDYNDVPSINCVDCLANGCCGKTLKKDSYCVSVSIYVNAENDSVAEDIVTDMIKGECIMSRMWQVDGVYKQGG